MAVTSLGGHLWDDDIGAPLNIDENGNVVAATQAWTCSNTDGTGRIGQELGSSVAISGDTNLSNFFWITLMSHPRTTSWRMYAISETITIPGGEPEVEISGPGHLALMAISLAGIGLTRRRIRR